MAQKNWAELLDTIKVKYQNPAGRLLAVLRRAEAIPPDIDARAAWGKAIRVDPSDVAAIYKQTAGLHEDYLAVKAYCETYRDHTHFWFEHLAKVGTAICPVNFATTFNEHKIRILPEVLFLLESIAAEMAEEAPIPEDELADLRASLETVRNSIAAAGLRGNIRRWLLELLRMMRDSVDRYENHGARGLRNTLFQLVGQLNEVYKQRCEAADKGDSEATAEVARMKEVGDVFQKVDKVTAVGARVPALYQMAVEGGTRLVEWTGAVIGYLT
ncbi:MAG: hypothetical protein WCK17_14445 [Verrucomicrobiota bacterium]